jgi:type I restriction enzyme, S subunit
MNKILLKNVAKYVKDRIEVDKLTLCNYVTTDNLLQNKQGVGKATNLPPNTGLVTNYIKEDILISNIRPYLKKIWFANNEGGSSSDVLTFRVNKAFCPKFVYYNLFSDDFFSHMMNGSKGTKMPRGDKNQILDFLIPDKPLSAQKKIAKVLSDLDSKIELNNRINGELEAMAKLVYDYWFVQFDFPNEEGKPYKSSGGEMVYSEVLGRDVPLGWEVQSILECCEIIDCLHSKKPESNFVSEDLFLLQLNNIEDNGMIDLSEKYYVNQEDYDKWTSRIVVEGGDIVITNAGRVAATAQIPEGLKTGIGRNITAIRPISIAPTYLFLSFQGLDIQSQIKSNTDVGSFFKSFNVKGIKKLNVIRPPKQIELNFEKTVKSIRKRKELVKQQNQELQELRDWLLPMLMNGQVQVEEAER